MQNFPLLDELHSLEGGERSTPRFVYVGGVTKARGLFEMAEAMRQLNERCFAELHLAGNFSPPSLKRELIDRLHFADIFLHGHVAREQVKRLLSEAPRLSARSGP